MSTIRMILYRLKSIFDERYLPIPPKTCIGRGAYIAGTASLDPIIGGRLVTVGDHSVIGQTKSSSVSRPSLVDIGKKYFEDAACKSSFTYAQYERYLSILRDEPIKILELGVHTGSSIATWEDFFPKATIVGLDINPLKREFGPRVRFVQGSQVDKALLQRISNEFAPTGWDIIIDDASHVASLSRATYDILFKDHLKSGGHYFIEDWGTGYWDDWMDGKSYKGIVQKRHGRFPSHDYGMVGFIKQLVDEAGMDSIKKRSTDDPQRGTMFHHMEVNFAFVLLKKM